MTETEKALLQRLEDFYQAYAQGLTGKGQESLTAIVEQARNQVTSITLLTDLQGFKNKYVPQLSMEARTVFDKILGDFFLLRLSGRKKRKKPQDPNETISE